MTAMQVHGQSTASCSTISICPFVAIHDGNGSAGKLGTLWHHVSRAQSFCLVQRKPQRQGRGGIVRPTYSRAALRDALKWAAAHAPPQPPVEVRVLLFMNQLAAESPRECFWRRGQHD